MTGPLTGPHTPWTGHRTGPVRFHDLHEISPVHADRSGRTGGPVHLFGGLEDPEGTGGHRPAAVSSRPVFVPKAVDVDATERSAGTAPRSAAPVAHLEDLPGGGSTLGRVGGEPLLLREVRR